MAKIEVDARAVTAYLEGLARRMSDRRTVLSRIGEYVAQVSKQSFREGADPGTGEPWKPLSPKYAAWKARKKKSKTPLTLTARLRRSIHYVISGESSVAIGTDTVYGRHHQFGEGVPRRRFLGISHDDRREIEAIAARWLRGRDR